jgi:lysophospholipase L1-like esterase
MIEAVLRRRLMAVVTSLVTIVLSALLLEGFLRLRFRRSLDLSMEMWKYATQVKQPVDDAQLSFRHLPSAHAFLMGVAVDINSQGLRDREYPLAKPPGVCRVLVLGDSTTLGWGVRMDDTAAKILERDLNEGSGGRFEVINAGVGNSGTRQEVTYYEHYGVKFQPDLIILQYFINDAEPVPREKRGFLIRYSYLSAFVSSRVDGLLLRLGLRPNWRTYYKSLYRDDQPGWVAAQTALRELSQFTREHGSRLLVGILPELRQVNGVYPFTEEHEKLKRLLAAEHVPVLDLIDGLRNHGVEESLWVTPLDDHPNARAHRLVAAQFRDWIVAHGFTSKCVLGLK